MRVLALGGALYFSVTLWASGDGGYAHREAPTNPVYLSEAEYPQLKFAAGRSPASVGAVQTQDEQALRRYQKTRTAADCDRAKSEVGVSLAGLYGAPHGPLSAQETEALSGFFEQVRNDADFFIHKIKREFGRKRPYEYIAGIEPCILKERSSAFPSGHAALAKIYALILKDFIPEKAEMFERRAKQIGDDRVLAGVHHPSDIQAGRALASVLYERMKKNDRYNSDFLKMKNALAKK